MRDVGADDVEAVEAPMVVVRALGVAVGIPVADEEMAARLREQWCRALTDESAEVTAAVGSLDANDPVAHDYAVTSRVTLAALKATAGERLNLHAGAVADPAGRALAVIGPSGAGKTTAIHRLARHLDYLSDETVSLALDLTVHPHPKPLSVIEDPERRTRKASVSPDAAGLRPTPAHSTLHRIVLLRRGQGTEGLVPITTPEAISEIVPQTSSLVLLDDPLLTLARTIDACGGAFALHYDEIEDEVATLRALLAAEPAPAPASVHHPSAEPVAVPGAWSRGPWVDAVQYAEQLVVLIGDTAHLLEGLGTTLWLGLEHGATVDELVGRAEQELGPHPQARELVEAALSELQAQQIVCPPGLSDAAGPARRSTSHSP